MSEAVLLRPGRVLQPVVYQLLLLLHGSPAQRRAGGRQGIGEPGGRDGGHGRGDLGGDRRHAGGEIEEREPAGGPAELGPGGDVAGGRHHRRRRHPGGLEPEHRRHQRQRPGRPASAAGRGQQPLHPGQAGLEVPRTARPGRGPERHRVEPALRRSSCRNQAGWCQAAQARLTRPVVMAENVPGNITVDM